MTNTSYPALSANAMAVLERRYLAKDRDGNTIEDPDGMFRRVARNLAQAEACYGYNTRRQQEVEDEFFYVMRSLEFLPNSPTLMNAGRELQQLSACFVLPVEDSLDAIFTQVKQTALIHKSGGGTGFSFSRIRPSGDVVGSTGGVASGPVSFINAFDAATDVVKQGGTRRGANMAILHCTHPDIMEFIKAKRDGLRWNNFNVSVAITDAFMGLLGKRDDSYNLINPRTGERCGVMSAKEVWRQICEMAWETGDPGVIYIDRINEDNPNPHVGELEATNPCAEQPLLPYESCTLGSLNLAAFFVPPEHYHPLRMPGYLSGDWPQVAWGRMGSVIRTAVHMLDNVIDMNEYPIPEIAHMSRQTRRIGLGVMGWADLLIRMGIRYDSQQAVDFADALMSFVRREAHMASADLGQRRGVYPAYLWTAEQSPILRGAHMRNTAPTTIAPTGTISIIAGVSSGIEPLYALSYVRNVMDGTQLLEVNPSFAEAAREGGWGSNALMRDLASGGLLDDQSDVPDDIKRLYRTTHAIAPLWHIKMQAAFQKHTDNAVSKTINLPHDATQEDVWLAYADAFRLGCKGITVYRDGTKANQVLSVGDPAGLACPDCDLVQES